MLRLIKGIVFCNRDAMTEAEAFSLDFNYRAKLFPFKLRVLMEKENLSNIFFKESGLDEF